MHVNTSFLHQSPPLRFVGGGIYRAEQGNDFPPHSHQTWEFVYYLAGTPLCPVGDAVYEASPGTLLVTPPATVHSEVARTAYSVLHFTVQAPVDYSWNVRYTDDGDLDLEKTCRALIKEGKAVSPKVSGLLEEQESMLQALMIRLDIQLKRIVRERCTLHPRERLVSEAERVMEECYGNQELGVQEVARRIGVSPSALRSAFAEVRQRSPRESLAEIRARRAISFLQTSDLKLEAIARLCGFDSASHLSRRIKQYAGSAPGMLRNR